MSNTPGLQTRLIQGARDLNATRAVMPPIYLTSTFELPSPEAGAEVANEIAPANLYTRYGSPNNKQVERVLADLEGAEAALAVASGMAAVSTALLSNLRAGDHIVAQKTHYTATLSLLSDILPRYGIEVTQVDQADAAAFAQAMRPNTRVVYTETPTNPTLELTDLRATAEIAHAAGALAITDNTFASAFNTQPLRYGYDLVIHSATKYLNGHSDVTAGVICGSRAHIERAWDHMRINGPMLHPFDAWLLRRGLLTYGMRMRTHNDNGLRVARALEAHPGVVRVWHPGLESHPQHALARAQMPGGFGGMVAFEPKGGFDGAYAMVKRVKLAYYAVSLGGVETLITHAASMIHNRQSVEQRAGAGIAEGLIRLSVGCEDADDIIADLIQALG